MLFDPSNPLILLVFMTGLALLPFLLLGLTSYVKLSVVFGLLRLAIGAQQIPSAMITSLLAILLSLFIMDPVVSQMREDALPIITAASEKKGPLNGKQAIELLTALYGAVEKPLRQFLERHSQSRERAFFAELSQRAGEKGAGESMVSLAAAFLVSELSSAFTFGFLLFLPFLVIDLVVANLLVGMGMTMVSPATIALPLKLFLFVCTDSWSLLIRSLLQSYR